MFVILCAPPVEGVSAFAVAYQESNVPTHRNAQLAS